MTRYSKYRILDIETVPEGEEEALRFAPAFESDKRLKDPEKIAEDLARKRTEWLADCALRAQTGKVAGIGFLSDGGAVNAQVGHPEGDLLYWFWNELLNSDPSEHYITFFGNGFDLPFLIRRSWKLGIGFPDWVMDERGFISKRFVDLAKTWACGVYQDRISLKHLALHLGVGIKDSEGSERFYALSQKEKEAHLRNDLILTSRAAHRMGVLHPHHGMLELIWPGSTTVQQPPPHSGESR